MRRARGSDFYRQKCDTGEIERSRDEDGRLYTEVEYRVSVKEREREESGGPREACCGERRGYNLIRLPFGLIFE